VCLCFEASRKFHNFFFGCRGSWSVTQKVMSNGVSYAFQPFNSLLQMLVTVKANMPILTLDPIFPSGEGLKNVEKLMFKLRPIRAFEKACHLSLPPFPPPPPPFSLQHFFHGFTPRVWTHICRGKEKKFNFFLGLNKNQEYIGKSLRKPNKPPQRTKGLRMNTLKKCKGKNNTRSSHIQHSNVVCCRYT
jgi:hypothetical protein